MKIVLLAILAFLSFSSAHAADGYKLQSVVFEFDKVKNPKTGSETRVSAYEIPAPPLFGNNGFIGVSIHRDRIISGNIVLEEYSDELMALRTIVIPAYLMIRAEGLTAGLKATWNSSLEIHGMEGKQIKDLFIAVFGGGKFSLGLGLGVGLNPNLMSLSSGNGLSIKDLESLFAVTGVGVQALSIMAEFKLAVTPTQIINVTTESGSSVETKNVSLGILKKTLE